MEGFYRQNEDLSWEFAPNFVYAPDYTLLKELKDTYKLPIYGWNWYQEQPYKIEQDEQTTI